MSKEMMMAIIKAMDLDTLRRVQTQIEKELEARDKFWRLGVKLAAASLVGS
jgi:hypothetical protein